MNLALSLLLHVVGIVIWVGGLMAMSRVMVISAKNPGPGRAMLSYSAGRFHIFALIGALLAAGSGLYQLSQWGMELFRRTHWMHVKLTLVLLLVGLHAAMWSVHRKWQQLGPDAKLPAGMASGLHGVVGLLLIGIVALVFFGRLHG